MQKWQDRKGKRAGERARAKAFAHDFQSFFEQKKNHKLNIDGKKLIWLNFIYIIFSLKQKKNPNTK